MPKYRNTTGRILPLPNGTRLGPDGEIVLTVQEAAAVGPALEMVGGQMLIEAPIGTAEVVIEEAKPAETVKIDLDGDGKADMEVPGVVVTEETK